MSIDAQISILSRLTQIMHNSLRGDYDTLECVFEFEKEGQSWSVGSTFSYVENGHKEYSLLNDSNDETSKLVFDLHELMQAQTGGNWKEFILTVDESRKAKSRFVY
jgi:hypothetical protein